jgi:quercetin dioxygenase-like cupin family protein
MAHKAIIVPPEQGRVYAMGRMRATFKADCGETANGYSVSEWWLEPRTRLPDQHAHDEDHVFYVIEGTLSLLLDEDWSDAAKGSYVVIPGGTPHAFENRAAVPAGFIAFTVPGGFEEAMPAIASALASENLEF